MIYNSFTVHVIYSLQRDLPGLHDLITLSLYLSPEISESQDSFSVCDNDSLDVVNRPVPQHLVHVAFVLDADEHALQNK